MGEQLTRRSGWYPVIALLALPACGTADKSSPSTSAVDAKANVASTVERSLEDYGLACAMQVDEHGVFVTLSNDTGSDARFLAWATPWDQNSDALSIRKLENNENVEYFGPIMTRIATDASYRVIPAGSTISARYAFEGRYAPPAESTFDVSLRSQHLLVEKDGNKLGLALDCPSVRLTSGVAEAGEVSQALLEPYPSCTDAQKDALQRMIDASIQAVRLSIDEFDHTNVGRLRWFGNFSGDPRTAFTRILAEDELVRCGGSACDDGDLGVVKDWFFDQKLYICSPVYAMPLASALAFDQQLATLVHELAHLVDQTSGSIVDWDNPQCSGWPDNKCYGPANALDLATHCTECAQRNAENYAYFASEAYMRGALAAAIF